MRRRRALVLGIVVMAALSGCSSAPAVDPVAVQNWLEEQNSLDVPGSLATLTGPSAPLEAEGEADQSVTVSFDEPVAVASLLFTCFGPETMSAEITLTGADANGTSTSQTQRTDDLPCDGSTQTLGLTQDAVTEVTASGLSADAVGAWTFFVVGKD
ncbi:hypothetical protein AB0O87_04370 [Microbacterium sp. NPDC076768]|uniref:hypothetical protein n=1 Tax=Microbacterium sp. NPDC076768 TaxID=3154858 RepID=UPI00342CF12C